MKKNIIINSFADMMPDLVKEWHFLKNSNFKPEEIAWKSNLKVWWKCSVDERHEWETSVKKRSEGAKCHYCTGQKVLREDSIGITHTKIASEWDSVKNGELTPFDVSYGSGKKVWWQCEKNHEWEAVINQRIKGSGCPYCSGNKATVETSIFTTHPDIASLWHPLKNKAFLPTMVSHGSEKQVWWQCEKQHEWKQTIYQMVNKGTCPKCSNRELSKENSLLIVEPELAKQWHPTKNNELTPKDVMINSSKKVWWLGKCQHEWEQTVGERALRKRGCPICVGKKVDKSNSLETCYPEIAKEWHPNKNKCLPSEVTKGSGKKVWWLCKKGHEWEISVSTRTTSGNGCPYCTNQKVCEDNSLAKINPNLAKEWHPIRNGIKTPCDVTAGSSKKAWWICKKGHEWKATIGQRNYGTGCPTCKEGYQSSFCESAIYYYINQIFPDAKRRPKLLTEKTEVDIFIPSLNVAIEYDGELYHQNLEKDMRKNNILTPYVTLIRIREFKCPLMNDPNVFIIVRESQRNLSTLNTSIKKVLQYISKQFPLTKSHYEQIEKLNICIEKDNLDILQQIEQLELEDSFAYNYPELIKHWHPTNNGKLEPTMFSKGSGVKVWWQCDKGHEYKRSFIEEAKAKKCPFCQNRKVCNDNSLASLYPNTAKEWHPTRNNGLTADKVVFSHSKKIWWKCDHGHEWQEKVVNRTKKGFNCPYCSGQRVCDNNSLLTVNPKLALEWHPTKNISITANDVTANSGEKVWWICENGHEWQANVYARNNLKTQCPYCTGRLATPKTSLLYTHPDIAKEWHPFKNKNLTSKDVKAGSHNKVWWMCRKGHEWEANIYSRGKNGRNCPYCTNQKANQENCLAKTNPTLTKEWHPKKNGAMTPNDVLGGSNKKAWWLCKLGHEWEANISSRNTGVGCPYCSNKLVYEGNCLLAINPSLAKEWHLTKNNGLMPNDVIANSNIKAWWQCTNGHEWESQIASRNRGVGCPYCSGRKVCKDNSLAGLRPDLAEEWHLIKNGSLTPNDVTLGSNKKVWWMCRKGHEWITTPNHRKNGTGCPYCKNKK